MNYEPISIAGAVAKAIATPPRQEVAPTTATPLPVLPDSLRQRVEQATPSRYTDGDGNAFVVNHEPMFHPEAARYLEQMRAALLPAPTEVILVWLRSLAKAMPAGAVSPESLFEGLLDACGDLPAPVWCAAARRQLLRNNKFLPGVAEIYAVLQAIAEPLRDQLSGLERVVRAPQALQPAEPLPPYRPVACTPPQQQRGKLPDLGKDDYDPEEAARQDQAARRSALDQIAALGVTEEQFAALRASKTPAA